MVFFDRAGRYFLQRLRDLYVYGNEIIMHARLHRFAGAHVA